MIALLKVYETLYQNDVHEMLYVMIVKSKFSDNFVKNFLLPYNNPKIAFSCIRKKIKILDATSFHMDLHIIGGSHSGHIQRAREQKRKKQQRAKQIKREKNRAEQSKTEQWREREKERDRVRVRE